MTEARKVDGPSWQMWLGDCLEVMRLIDLASVSLLLADPPYGVDEPTNRLAKGRSNETASIDFGSVVGDDRPFDPAPFVAFPRCILIIPRQR